MKLSEILKKIKENPEDLSPLTDAIAIAQNMEEQDFKQVEQIGKLQENYRKVLQLVPIPGEEKQKEEPTKITLEQALGDIKNYINGGVV